MKIWLGDFTIAPYLKLLGADRGYLVGFVPDPTHESSLSLSHVTKLRRRCKLFPNGANSESKRSGFGVDSGFQSNCHQIGTFSYQIVSRCSAVSVERFKIV